MVQEPSASRRWLTKLFRPLLVLLLLLLVIEMGLEGSLRPHLTSWLWPRWPIESPAPTALSRQADSDRRDSALPAVTSAPAMDATAEAPSLDSAAPKSPATVRHPPTTPVELTLYDREGDRLRQARGMLTSQERRVVTTFDSIHGAYGGTVLLPNNTTAPIIAVERADMAANLAILSLQTPPVIGTAMLQTLEALADVTYEDTAAEQRYLAEKRATAQRWEEALGHWKRAIALDSSLRPDSEASLAEAFLNASAAALHQERRVEAHARLLDAVDWLPEHGGVRLRLAESYARMGEPREAIEQYWLALDLLPAQATDIASALVRLYDDWGRDLLRQGDFVSAANLFREALQVDATNAGVYFGLGLAEFRRQAFDAAIEALENAITYEPGLRGEVEPYLSKARALLAGPETAVITFPPGSSRIEVLVVVNSRMQLPFIIDTGASMTLIPAWAAEMLGYRPPATSEWIRVQTAGGPRRLPYAALSRIEIQGLGLSNLPVLFGDLPGYDASRGLLGMDFLRHFSMAVDHELGRMTLRMR
jgi:tetratricopeptide (TPR) repeat protein